MAEKTYHHKNLKNDLIKTGIEIVSSEGKDKLSLRRVAAACGVSHAAPYSHFKNKEELLEAMQVYITEQLSEALSDVIKTHKSDAGILERVGKEYVMFFVKNPFYFSFLFTESNLKIDLTQREGTTMNFRPFEIYRELVLSLLEKVGFPGEKRKDAVIATWSFVHGLTAVATMNQVQYDEDWEVKLPELLMMLNCSY